MTGLSTLDLSQCDLVSLPAEFSNLHKLQQLDLSSNKFVELPSVYKLRELQTLDISHNRRLTRIEEGILQLEKLSRLCCTDCSSLKYPPYEVCQQRLTAIKAYFIDLQKHIAEGTSVEELPLEKLKTVVQRLEKENALLKQSQNSSAEHLQENKRLTEKNEQQSRDIEQLQHQLQMLQAANKSSEDEEKPKTKGTLAVDPQSEEEESGMDELEEQQDTDAESAEAEVSSDYDEQAIPLDVYNHLDGLCLKYAVTNSLYFQHPDDWKKVIILGDGAENILKTELEDVGKRFGFIVTTENHHNQSFTQNFTNGLCVEQHGFGQHATCELIVEATSNGNQSRVAYAVGPGHMMMSEEEKVMYQSGRCEIELIRQQVLSRKVCEVEVQREPARKFLRAHDNQPPLLGYRYRYNDGTLSSADSLVSSEQPSNQLLHKHCMNDAVLLPFDFSEAQNLQRELRSLRRTRRETLVQIKTMAEFKKYNRLKDGEEAIAIVVKNFSGYIAWNPFSAEDQRRKCFGYHLVFKLDNKHDELQPGDSGSVVYRKMTRGKEVTHHPLGIFVGTPIVPRDVSDSGTYYQLVLLCQALRDIESDYPQIKGLRPLQIDEGIGGGHRGRTQPSAASPDA